MTWLLQYDFRSCHNSVIQSIQWSHDRGKLILYTSAWKSTEKLVFFLNSFVLIYVYFQFQFTFILQCSFKSEPVNMIVWINSSHFQDTQSGYNDITFQEGFNFYCLSGGALDLFRNSLFSDFYAAFPQ